MHARLIVRRELATGVVHLADDCVVHLDRLTAPLTLMGSSTDAIASAAAVEAGVRVFTGSADAVYVEVDGLSHLGLVASAAASTLTWPVIEERLAHYDQA